MSRATERGRVIAGPDLFGPHRRRPYVRLSGKSHPFADEEALYAAVTTTERPLAIHLREDEFEHGSFPRESFVNPWTLATIKHADVGTVEGHLEAESTDQIATAAAGYLGVSPSPDRRED